MDGLCFVEVVLNGVRLLPNILLISILQNYKNNRVLPKKKKKKSSRTG